MPETQTTGIKKERKFLQKRTFTAPAAKPLSVIEIEDALFHLNSAVLMVELPKGSEKADDDQKKITGLGILYAAYSFFKKNPKKRLVIAGHTDTSGGAEYNFELAALRAQGVLYLLTGERDKWAKNSHLKHRVEDYQQILRDVGVDPGSVDNKIGPKTRRGLADFKTLYETFRKKFNFEDPVEIPDKDLEGERLGIETWKAIFDVYMLFLGFLLGCNPTKKELQPWRDLVKFVDEEKPFVACGESFPIDSKKKDNYRSAENRRVELLFFDADEAPVLSCPPARKTKHLPHECPIYRDKLYNGSYIDPTEDIPQAWIDIQTVDEFGAPVGNVDLILQHAVGEIKITTNGKGYHRKQKIPQGILRVVDSDHNQLNFYGDGGVHAAVMFTPLAYEAITSVIVKYYDEKTREEHKKVRQKYFRKVIDPDEEKKKPKEDQTKELFRGRGDQDEKKDNYNWVRCRATDNIALAAGWSGWFDKKLDVEELIDTMKQWLGDYNTSIKARKAIVFMFNLHARPRQKITIYTTDGKVDGEEFELKETVAAPYGTYGFYQIANANVFLDVASQTFALNIRNISDETRKKAEEIAGEGTRNVPIQLLIQDSQQEDFVKLVQEHPTKVRVVYVAPYGGHLANLALHGGTGVLEDYVGKKDLRSRIHKRNLNVIDTVNAAYRGYLKGYIEKIDAVTTDKYIDKDKFEKASVLKKNIMSQEAYLKAVNDLYKLGPPLEPYRFPYPSGADKSQRDDLFDKIYDASSYQSWVALAGKLSKLAGQHEEGAIFFRLSITLKEEKGVGPVKAKVAVKYNLDMGTDGILFKPEKTFSGELGGSMKLGKNKFKLGGGVEHEVDLDTGEEKTTAKLALGKLDLEVCSDGTQKAGWGAAKGEFNLRESTGGYGIQVPLTIKDPTGKYEVGEVYVGLHFQSVREGTLLAYFSHAPGFFEKRSLANLMSKATQWNDLNLDEQAHLTTLKWNRDKWDRRYDPDFKDFPDTCGKEGFDLPAEQKVAIMHLGFTYKNWKANWDYLKNLQKEQKQK